MTIPTPPVSLTITLSPNGKLHCELPGRNGSRRKVDLDWDDSALARSIRAKLEGERCAQVEKRRLEAVARHNSVYGYVAATQSIPFAERTVGRPTSTVMTGQLRAMLRQDGYSDVEIAQLEKSGHRHSAFFSPEAKARTTDTIETKSKSKKSTVKTVPVKLWS